MPSLNVVPGGHREVDRVVGEKHPRLGALRGGDPLDRVELGEAGEHRRVRPRRLVELAVDVDVDVGFGHSRGGHVELTGAPVVDGRGRRAACSSRRRRLRPFGGLLSRSRICGGRCRHHYHHISVRLAFGWPAPATAPRGPAPSVRAGEKAPGTGPPTRKDTRCNAPVDQCRPMNDPTPRPGNPDTPAPGTGAYTHRERVELLRQVAVGGHGPVCPALWQLLHRHSHRASGRRLLRAGPRGRAVPRLPEAVSWRKRRRWSPDSGFLRASRRNVGFPAGYGVDRPQHPGHYEPGHAHPPAREPIMKPILALALLAAVAACDATPGGRAFDEVGDPVAISLLDDGTIIAGRRGGDGGRTVRCS